MTRHRVDRTEILPVAIREFNRRKRMAELTKIGRAHV